jgi:hypothetical protein
MMTRRDGKVHEKEMPLVNAIANQLEILKGTQQDIFDLFCHIKNRNWQESALYFSSHLLNPEHFKHLLTYYEISFDELMEETKEIRQGRLIDILKPKLIDSVEWGAFNCEGSSQKATLITKKPATILSVISSAISNALILPWLQLMLDKGALRVTKEQVKILENKDGVETLLFNFSQSLFAYEQEANSFYLKTVECEQQNVVLSDLLDNFLYYTDLVGLVGLTSLDDLLTFTGASGVALASGENLPTCDGFKVSAIAINNDSSEAKNNTWMHAIEKGNAVNKVSGDEVEIIQIYGSSFHLTNSGSQEFKIIPMKEMLIEHGFYLVK